MITIFFKYPVYRLMSSVYGAYWKSVLPYLSTDVVAQYLEHHTRCEWWHHAKTKIPIRFKNIPPIMYEYLCVHYDELIQHCIQNKYVRALNVLHHSHMIVCRS